MEKHYVPGLTLERRDNSKGYTPFNAIFADRKAQNRNTRRNRMLTYEGRTECLSAFAEEFGLRYSTLWDRLNRGWTVERALETPA